MKRFTILTLVLIFGFSPVADAAKTETNIHYSAFDNHYTKDPSRPRNHWWPILTFIVPGLDQFIEGQTTAGYTYAGYALVGAQIAITAQDKLHGSPGQDDLDSRDNRVRQVLLGEQMYQTAGALSAYQAFRSTIQVYRDAGVGYEFIHSDDTTLDIALAPFDLSFFTDPKAVIPLGIALGLVVASANSGGGADHYIDGSDIGFLSATSYQAGVSEEAIFRGWLMPGFRQSFGSDFWANFAQGTLFGAAHYSKDNRFPIFQAAMGYYFGWMTVHNGWSVRESAFVHAWWDVLAFTAEYLSDKDHNNKDAHIFQIVNVTY